MRKLLKSIFIVIIGIVVVVAGTIGVLKYRSSRAHRRAIASLTEEVPLLIHDDLQFRDLNKNGRLDVYEDRRQPLEARVDDLLGQMELEEKVGLMFQPMIGVGEDGEIIDTVGGANPMAGSEAIITRHIRHFNIYQAPAPRLLARWHNAVQDRAARTRLGIPVLISSDPRHATREIAGAAVAAGGFSVWPEPLGLAATWDPSLVGEFARIANQEYRAVGIRCALHPMADLATEPRWARCSGTFGEDRELATAMTLAYINGFQGPELNSKSVACMVKHFPGGGPQKDGEDAHFSYGKDQVYPGDNFDYHLAPFLPVLEIPPAQVMPYYGVPVGQTSEDVGMSFNREIITDLLRDRLGYDGVVCTDWGILDDATFMGILILKGKYHGVEELSVPERMRKALDAGVDQFGGDAKTDVLRELVSSGQIGEARIDVSVRRLLRNLFRLGLFDDPFVDEEQAAEVVGKQEFIQAGRQAQQRSLVMLKRGFEDAPPLLPLHDGAKLYVENINAEVAASYGEVVTKLEDADVAIVKLQAPFEPRDGDFLERMFHQGDLDFKEPDLSRILDILAAKPTVVAMNMDRPPVIPEIAEQAGGLFVHFGVSDEVLLDGIFGRFNPSGRLPMEIPSSMAAVRAQKEDLPYDSDDPLFPFGFGMSYEAQEAASPDSQDM